MYLKEIVQIVFMCIYRPVRAHCTELQCIPSASSVHAFRKAEQTFDLLDYERSYLKNCVNGAFMPPQAMPLTQILRYETHIIIVLCSPERMHSLTVQYALFYRYLHYANFWDRDSQGRVKCQGGYGGYNHPENRNGCFHYKRK